jgi:hypothetical protein
MLVRGAVRRGSMSLLSAWCMGRYSEGDQGMGGYGSLDAD